MMRYLRTTWIGLIVAAANAVAAPPPAISLVPPASSSLLTPEYFGIHVHNTGPVRRWPDIPAGSLRLWDSRVAWANLEPRQGRWDFSRLDEFVSWAESRRMEILLPLGVTPRWASARPDEAGAYGAGLAAEPANIEHWRNYVRTVAERYRGRVGAYEIWNEANIKNFYSGSIDTLAQLTIAAAEEIRRADPAARIVAPSGVGLDSRVEWPSQILAAGVASVVQAASFHIYHGAAPPESMIDPLRKLKAFNKAAGFDAMPMWNTEFGYWMSNEHEKWDGGERRNEMSEQTVADYLPRDLLLAAALGFQRFYWYSWDNTKMGLIDPTTSSRRRAASVYAQAIESLSGAKLESCIRNAIGLWTCKLQAANGAHLLALWTDPGAAEPVQTVSPAVRGKWVRLDGVSTWAPQPAELKIVSVVTLVTDAK